jgi:aminomethyltransferase
MKRTPLYDHHLFFDARMVKFAGFEMPLHYGSIEDEHDAVRTNAGYFDVSHMGEFLIEGEGATEIVDHVFSNTLPPIGKATYGFILEFKGGALDDVLVYRFAKDKFWIVCNASNIDKVNQHIGYRILEQGYKGSFSDISDNLGLVAVQGPNAHTILKEVLNDDLDIKRFHFKELTFNNETIIVSRTGYTGEDGFEIYGPPKTIIKFWEKMAETTAVPCGLGARDTLRFEAGLPLYGEEIISVLTPYSSNLGAFIDESKLDTYGMRIVLEKKEKGTHSFLAGLELQDKGIARSGYGVYIGKERVGEITTGYKLKNYPFAKALAFMRHPYDAIGTEVEVVIRDHRVKAVVIPYPFYQKPKKKKV